MNKKKIEPLDPEHIKDHLKDLEYMYVFKEIVDKINEIIDRLNEEEK